MLKKLVTFWSILILTLSLGQTSARALDIAITDNGSGATSEVQTQQTNTTTVEQTNDTSVQNQVEANADTGNNTVSDNGGNTQITTGDIETTTNIDTTVNHSQVDTGCCQNPGDTQITISGNGEGSTNTVNLNQANNTDVNVNQIATITNKISISAITGKNTANGNDGNVSIITGKITGMVNVGNQANTTVILVGTNPDGSLIVKIKGNGTDSINTINYNDENNILVQKTDISNIFNQLDFALITGENVANDNNGDVYIKTGDIALITNVDTQVNYDLVEITCCAEKPVVPPVVPPVIPPVVPPVVPPVTPPNNPPGNGGPGPNSSPGPSNESGNGGSSGGEILPATGTMDYILFLFANIIMLLLGCYLRLKSGNAQ